ncbi:uncharacterized protein F5147DRAFT_832565 [Suillus discolor]|uniref:Uncharacterized protein n=1 Tax=Suillus discolor TaxID=1912936 RepID=A0A9P7FJB0_9AGAM|nr:uncharacterized protein F5147DRAFT_832565 [Suillus discolor]KAG2118706.1 hypothetical protein F5147DRAFT_832565 [Suillus discolor]
MLPYGTILSVSFFVLLEQYLYAADISHLSHIMPPISKQQRRLLELAGDVKHTSFSKVDSTMLASKAEALGLTGIPGCLPIETTRFLISLVRGCVATVTEAGCRILINTLLLRVVSVMCPDTATVNIIPEFPIPSTIFNQGSARRSFSGIVDFLVTKLPTPYTGFLLTNPTKTLVDLGNTQEPTSPNIFEAKRDRVREGLPQATIAAASYCQLRGLHVIRGVVTNGEQWIFFVYRRHTNDTDAASCQNNSNHSRTTTHESQG